MNQISAVQISSVDPMNYYNPRTLGVAENVERLKSSIDRFGYLEEFPITVCRSPEPNTDGYDYRYVSGQCRLRACQELGLEKIPAIILDLSDDEARQRAWIENELRSDLLLGDKARFTEKVYYEHSGDGRTPDKALELAAYGKDAASVAGLRGGEHGGKVGVTGTGERKAAMGINVYGNGVVSTYDKNGNLQGGYSIRLVALSTQ